LYVIDVAEGEKVPRKGGPGITRSDLLVINKIDLDPYVGASLEVMEGTVTACVGSGPSTSGAAAGSTPWKPSSAARGCSIDLPPR